MTITIEQILQLARDGKISSHARELSHILINKLSNNVWLLKMSISPIPNDQLHYIYHQRLVDKERLGENPIDLRNMVKEMGNIGKAWIILAKSESESITLFLSEDGCTIIAILL